MIDHPVPPSPLRRLKIAMVAVLLSSVAAVLGVGAEAQTAPAPELKPGLSGLARARATGYDQNTSQPGATLFGDVITETQSPIARVDQEPFSVGALASSVYPGDVVATISGLLQVGGAPPTPPYPIEARAAFPPSGQVGSDASLSAADAEGVRGGTMRAHAEQHAGSASATASDVAPAGESATAPFRAQSIVTDARTGTLDGRLTAVGLSSGSGISIAGGVVRIGRYESRAEASSDGKQGGGKASTVTAGVMVGDVEAVLDESGVHPLGGGDALKQVLMNQALAEAGVQVAVAPSSGGPERGSPSTGVAQAGGIVVVIKAQDVTQTFTIGGAEAKATVIGASADAPPAQLGSAAPPPDGSVNVGAGVTRTSTPPAVASGSPREQAAAVTPGAAVRPDPLSQRRGVGGLVLPGLAASVAVATLLFGYARWQLLAWLPVYTEPGG